MAFPIHRHMAVTRDGQLGGIVSVRDLVVCLINLQGSKDSRYGVSNPSSYGCNRGWSAGGK